MNKSRFFIILGCLLYSVDLFATDVSTIVGVSTELVSPGIDIDCSTALDFGNIIYTGNGGSVLIDASSLTRSLSSATNGSIANATTGTIAVGNGICAVTISSGVSASIGSITQGTALGTGLTVSNLHTYPDVGSSLTAGTTTDVRIGGTLTVSSGTVAGTYSGGTFTLTINY